MTSPEQYRQFRAEYHAAVLATQEEAKANREDLTRRARMTTANAAGGAANHSMPILRPARTSQPRPGRTGISPWALPKMPALRPPPAAPGHRIARLPAIHTKAPPARGFFMGQRLLAAYWQYVVLPKVWQLVPSDPNN